MAVFNIPHKIQVLEYFSIGQYNYRVADHIYDGNVEENTRNIEFTKPDTTYFYLHSSVYLDKRKAWQPIYDIPQELISFWRTKANQYKNALVLGCAGCTIPRFLVLNYPVCKVLGIEISSQLIDIAKKYFYIQEYDSQFTLIQEDAFSYIEKYPAYPHFDIVYVDLFDGDRVPAQILTMEFITSLMARMEKNSLAIINLLDMEDDAIRHFQKMVGILYRQNMLITHDNRKFLIFANGSPLKWGKLGIHFSHKYDVWLNP